MNSRQQILDRIRTATSGDRSRYEDLPRGYIHAGALENEARIQLMTERLREYGAEVVECAASDLPATISPQLRDSGRHRFIVPDGVPHEWLAEDFTWLRDQNLIYDEIEQCAGVMTAASAGVADSGTIILHHGPAEGRRIISLLPDFHLCILRASQIVETMPEYFARFPNPPRLATFISGPSATADIEMTRIKGVHGPRFLSVIIVRDDA
ncbi:LutC/YkgG family protein [Occallatibacter savannae]|uniref:LutC/YkgG family protein n=1 Tax=Occallatibacter savannae TaxID=1002691 RepID=UPI000D691F12|nr:lactate utilization protein C [Occallatibacter savannae]